MKRILMIVILVGLIVPTAVNAQKVYKDGSNRVILDMTVAAGMPEGAATNVKKEWIGTPSNTKGPLVGNEANGTIDAMVFQKLEVARHDVNTLKEIKETGTMTMNWAAAFAACKGSSSYGGNWRLPTQREWMLMYIFKPALEAILVNPAINGTVFSTTERYWTATEENNIQSRAGGLVTGQLNLGTKTSAYRVRCVREVTN